MSSILVEPMVRKAAVPLPVGFYHQAGDLGLIGDDVELLDGNEGFSVDLNARLLG